MNNNFSCCQPPPDIRLLHPPPKPPWIKFSPSCSKYGIEAKQESHDTTTASSLRTNRDTPGYTTQEPTTRTEPGTSPSEGNSLTHTTHSDIRSTPSIVNTSGSLHTQIEPDGVGSGHFAAYVAIGVLSSVVVLLIIVLILVKKRYVKYPVQPRNTGENSNFLWNYRIRGIKWRRWRSQAADPPRHFAVVTMTGDGPAHLKTKAVLDSSSSSEGSQHTGVYPDIVQSALKTKNPHQTGDSYQPKYPLLAPIQPTNKATTSSRQAALDEDDGEYIEMQPRSKRDARRLESIEDNADMVVPLKPKKRKRRKSRKHMNQDEAENV